MRPAPRRSGLRGRAQAWRAGIDERPALRKTYKTCVGLLGAIVLVLGILAIPYPGPGWAIVFIGLAILASEFTWARRVLHYARGKYDAWTDWLGRQSISVRLAVLALTGLVVLATLWLLGAAYLVAGWVGLDGWTWLRSPLF